MEIFPSKQDFLKKIRSVGGIISILVVILLVYVFIQLNRYKFVESRGAIVRIDKITGKVEMVYPKYKHYKSK